MNNVNYPIRFSFAVDAAKIRLTLEAEVQEHHSDTYYIVSNFQIPGYRGRALLPPVTIQNMNGHWVHRDNGKPTELSTAIGEAIDARNGSSKA
ncbi:MAG TPA: hypothetical protein VMH27_22270 [Puia sp.]|nr:hypothetical protein [Puia sp.]